jgi:hypothetical protein
MVLALTTFVDDDYMFTFNVFNIESFSTCYFCRRFVILHFTFSLNFVVMLQVFCTLEHLNAFALCVQLNISAIFCCYECVVLHLP